MTKLTQSALRISATPLVESTPLSRLLGRKVFLKFDSLRPSGSFKDRGMTVLLEEYKRRGIGRVVSSSGGNAGLACAYCARKLGLRATVVVPETTKPLMLDKIRDEGAEVMVHGENWNAADKKAREIIASDPEGIGYAHPFDDPLLWDGHSSVVHEIKEQLVGECDRPGAVVVAVGGGGLLGGVLQGLSEVGWQSVPVLTAETHGADCLSQAMKQGRVVTLPGIDSIATSLGARAVSEGVFKKALNHSGGVHPTVVSDADTVRTLLQFLDDHRSLVEPACAAALSLVYNQHEVLDTIPSSDPLVVIVCGGSGINRSIVEEWRRRFCA